MFEKDMILPGLGTIPADNDFIEVSSTSDGLYKFGKDGVNKIFTTGDKKVEFIAFSDKTMAFVPSVTGFNAYYPVLEVNPERPAKAVLMDLDGTSVKSEEFWMSIIEATTAELTGNPHFQLEAVDAPFVAGHSVSEHLTYCIEKYCPDKALDDARAIYFDKVDFELKEIMAGRGREGAFTPTEGLKDFLYMLKGRGVKIGLVTSGLYEKAMPEIISAFRTLKMGDPVDFYDAIITAGTAFKAGETGTMSELPIKPHPWVYSETYRFGLKMPFEGRNSVVAIEDSGAGVCSARIAGFYTIGLAGGNILKSGTKELCGNFVEKLSEIENIIF